MNRFGITIVWMLLCISIRPVLSQSGSFADRLQEKLTLYYSRHVPTKIHLAFNQAKYAAGDTAYYRVDFFSADTFQPISGSPIINVHLVDARGSLVREEKVLLKDGVGFSYISLPENAAPGKYSVVAFNDVMRDYDPSLFFQIPLWISGPVMYENDAEDHALEFFPEGGHFIAGITNKVVVRGTPNSSGAVFSPENTEVVSFSLDHQGLGFFLMTPDGRRGYYATFQGTRTPLPQAEADGIGLLVGVPANGLPIRVTLQLPKNSSLKSEKFTFAFTRHSKVYFTAELTFDQKNFLTFSVPQENVRAGVARLTIFKADGQAIAERMVYIPQDQTAEVKVIFNKNDFSVREKIPFSIGVKNSQGVPMRSKFSVTVYQDFSEGENDPGKNVADNAFLYGDLPGSLLKPKHFSTDQRGLRMLDSYLIAQEWNRFSWEDVLNEKLPSRPLREYVTIPGTAVMTDGRPLPDSTRITFFLQESIMTYVAYVKQNGKFDLVLLIHSYADEEVFYRAESNGKVLPNLKVEPDPTFSVAAPISPIKPRAVADEFDVFARKRKAINQSYSYRRPSRTYETPPSLNAFLEEEVFGADVVINLDEYLLFPTMTETLREIVPMVQHRKRKARDVVKVFLEDQDRFADDEPLFVIDGVITDNVSYFLSLKPSDVVRIKVIHTMDKLRTFGLIGMNGLVLVETKIPGNAAMVPRSDNTFQIQGLSVTHAGRHYTRSENALRVPDLRTNLFWNPAAETDESGNASYSFLASDVAGKFKIRIEGFTVEGQPFFAEEDFRISFKPR